MDTIFFRERGNGTPVILLHGFPMNHRVWDNFAEELSRDFKIFTPDLPGFGNSKALPSPFTIDDVAEDLLSWLHQKKLSKAVLIGHSLGGYVTLAMAKKNPEIFSALGLFHSTALADSDEKKQSRNKVLEFIDNHGVAAFTGNFISTLFADPQHPSVARVRSLSMEATETAVKGYTMAMRDRRETTQVLKTFKGNILFLAGEKDQGIPADTISRQAALAQKSELHILPGVAHMGMFENEKRCLEIIHTFILKSSVTT